MGRQDNIEKRRRNIKKREENARQRQRNIDNRERNLGGTSRDSSGLFDGYKSIDEEIGNERDPDRLEQMLYQKELSLNTLENKLTQMEMSLDNREERSMKGEQPSASTSTPNLQPNPPKHAESKHTRSGDPGADPGIPANAEALEEWDVFISYNWTQQDDVHAIVAKVRLGRNGRSYAAWVDNENMLHGDMQTQMADGIRRSRAVAVFYSTEYWKSTNCVNEVRFAQTINKPIVFIRMRNNVAEEDKVKMMKPDTEIYTSFPEKGVAGCANVVISFLESLRQHH